MSRAQCPHCNSNLPVLIFTGNRVVERKGDTVLVNCPKCNQVIKAESSEAHKKNFVYIFLVPLLATPVVISLQQFIPSGWKAFYYLLCYVLLLAIPTVLGQHKMHFSKQ